MKRSIVFILASGLFLAGGSACSRAEWEALFDRPGGRQVSRPIPPSRQTGRQGSSVQQPSAPAAQRREPRVPRSTDEPETYYQVVLISESASAVSPPDMKRIRLRRAQAESAARLLELLYLPVGVGGGNNQQYLIYQSPLVWKASAGMAALLDVKMADRSEAVVPPHHADAFRAGVAMAMRAYQPGPLDTQALKNAENCFQAVINATDAPAKLRWIAAILAGKLLTDLAYRYPQAQSHFALAEQHAPAESLEKMIALYHRADTFRQEDKRKEAHDLFERILDEFTMHDGTNLYQRCMGLAAE